MQDPTLYSQIKPQFPEQEHLKCPRCDSPNTKFCYYNNYNLSQPRHFCKSCRRYWTKGGALRNIPVGGGSRKNTKRTSSSSSSSTKRSSAAVSPTTTATTSTVTAATTTPSSPSTTQVSPKPEPYSLAAPASFDLDRRLLDVSGGSFSSLLASNVGQFGSLLEGLNPTGSNLQLSGFMNHGPSSTTQASSTNQNPPIRNPNTNNVVPDLQVGFQNGNSQGFLSVQGGEESGCWNTSNGWPDLAIYTPGSSFQ